MTTETIAGPATRFVALDVHRQYVMVGAVDVQQHVVLACAYRLAHPAHKLLEFFLACRHAGYRYPGLTVPWAGFMNDAGGGTDAFNLLLCFAVVQLDEGPRIISNIVNLPIAEVTCEMPRPGMRVKVGKIARCRSLPVPAWA